MIHQCKDEGKVLVALFPSYHVSGTIVTHQLNIEADKSSHKFSSHVICDRWSSTCGFPALMVVRGEDDCNAVEVMVANPSVVTEDVISIDNIVKHNSFKLCLLDEIGIDTLQFHGCYEVFITRVIMG
jgi:hypothetical protein